MDDNVLFILEGDSAGAVGSLEEIAGALESLDAQMGAAAAAAGDLDGLTATFSGISEAAAGLDGVLSGATDALDALATQAATASENLATVGVSADAASGQIDAAATSADAASGSLDTMAASTDAAAASADALNPAGVAMIGLAAVAAGGMFIKMGADGEDALTRVQALTGASQAQMSQYGDAITSMAGTYGKSVADLSGGLYDIVSVGFQGADALNTLKVASEAAAAGGVDLHTVTSGLTSIMKAYGVQGKDAATVMDTLLLGVRDGKASFQDYSNAIGLVATTAKGAGFSLQDSTAALSTLTAVFPNARRAGMDLQHLMTSIGVDAAATGKAAEKMGLNFNQSAFNSMSLQQRLQYLQQITHGNQAEMLKLTGGTAGFAAAQVLLANNSSDFTRNLKDMKNATGATKNAFDIWSHSIGAHAANMTGALSAIADKFVVLTGPAITGGLDAVAHALGGAMIFVTQHADAVKAGLVVLAGALIGALIPALIAGAAAGWELIAPLLATAAPFILVGAALAGLVLLVKYAYDHFKPFRDAVNAAHAAIAQFGQEIMQRAGPAIHNIQLAIAAEMPIIKAVWNDVWPQLQTVFTAVWGVIQGVIKVAWAIISGVIKVGLDLIGGNWKGAWTDMQTMFKGIWDGIAQILGSVLLGMRNTFLNGLRPILQAVALIPGPIGDMARKALGSINTLESGTNKSTAAMAAKTKIHADEMKAHMLTASASMHLKVAAEFAQQAKDIEVQLKHTSDPVKRHALEMRLAMVNNAEEMHRNAARKAARMATEVNSSTHLLASRSRADAITMRTDVGTQFTAMVTQAASSALHLVSQVGATLGGLTSKAFGWGRDMVGNLIHGITSMIGSVGSAASSVASHIANFLHFSVPEKGPLATIEQWMPDMGRVLTEGMRQQEATIITAARHMAAAVSSGFSGGMGGLGAPGLMNGAGLGAGGGLGLGGAGGATQALLAQILAALRSGGGAGGQLAPLGAAPTSATLGSVTQNLGGVNISGVSDINSLYQQLNMLAGLAIENGSRGATAGLGL